MQNPRVANNRAKKIPQIIQPNNKLNKTKDSLQQQGERNFGKDMRNISALNGNNKSLQNKDIRSLLTARDNKPKITQETEKKKCDNSFMNTSKIVIDNKPNSFIIDKEEVPEMDVIFKGNLYYLSEYGNTIFKDLFANESKFIESHAPALEPPP